MSLPDVVLSLLREPMSGSELIGVFRGTMRHFWSTDLSQIYRALEALEGEGCVRVREVPSGRGPARKVYRLTAAGRRRIAAWLARPPRIPAARFEYLAQLFSVTAAEHPRDQARRMLESIRRDATGAVAVLEQLDERFRDVPGYPSAMPTSLFYPWLTLRHGLLRRRALVEWIDECLELLDRRPADAGGDEAVAEVVEMLRLMAEDERQGSAEGENVAHRP